MTKSVVTAVAVLLIAAGGATAWRLVSPRDRNPARAAVTVDTTPVTRTTLTTTTQLSGTLGYSGAYTVNAQRAGTITAIPAPGTLIQRGRKVFEVDGQGVYLFYGNRPAWRRFAAGMSPGPDVRELERNLIALGFGANVVADSRFDWATEWAVRAWQQATKQTVTGTISLGRITFASSPLRVISDTASVGASAQPGLPVLAASSPRPVVTVPVPATQTYLVHRGDRVTVTVPSGASSTGRVTGISLVAAPSANSGSSGNQSDGPNGPPQLVSVPALVRLDHPSIAANLDQAPVTVRVVDRRVADVLAVPITSLVALAGGGYGVWVRAAGSRQLVGVTPGLFAQTLVQVTSPRLRAGDLVEVPAK